MHFRSYFPQTAFSGALPLRDALEGLEARVIVRDPQYSDEELLGIGLAPAHKGERAEAVIVQADYKEYRSWSDDAVPGVSVVVDGRGLLDEALWPLPSFVLRGRG